MITPKYEGFRDREDVAREFQEGEGPRWDPKVEFKPVDGFPTDAEIIYAQYEQEDYEGSAFVLFKRGRKLFEVSGSHCSCMGLEEQWKPEETTWAALAIRPVGYQMPQVVLTEALKRVKR